MWNRLGPLPLWSWILEEDIMTSRELPELKLSDSSKKALVGAGVGVGLALLGTVGRKFVAHGPAALAGDWDDALKAEHQMARDLFDKLGETPEKDKAKRTMLLTKLKQALGKHAFEEENAVYPAMRGVVMTAEADDLNRDHGYVKQYLYDLADLIGDHVSFQSKLAVFRKDIEKHMTEEETKLFPKLKTSLGKAANQALKHRMTKEGMKLS